jgi:hypothetical protein
VPGARSVRQYVRGCPTGRDRQEFDTALKTWYRSASREHHPDHGGDTRNMIIVNCVYESLSRVNSEVGNVK